MRLPNESAIVRELLGDPFMPGVPEDDDCPPLAWEDLPVDGGKAHRPAAERRLEIEEIPSVREFASAAVPWIIEKIIPAGAVVGFTGAPGCGKTTLALTLAGAVASGQPFAGLAVERRPVLYLDRENPAHVIAERLDRLGIEDGGALRIWGGWLPQEVPALGGAAVLSWAMRCEPRPFILGDSFISFLGDGDENSSGDVRRTLQQARQLADIGCAVAVLHHSGKGDSTKDYRGSSDFPAGIDIGFTITHLENEPGRLGLLRLRPFKARVAVLTDLAILLSAAGGRLVEAQPALSDDERVVEILRERPGLASRELDRAALERGMSRARLRGAVERLRQAGAVTVRPGDRNRALHYVADAGLGVI